MPDSLPLPNGHLLQHYRIEKVLGQGGFGLTYLAVDTLLDKRVVIKENFPPDFAERLEDGSVVPVAEKDEAFQKLRENFLNEARMLARFEHPNIAPVHSYFEENGTAYFVMPFLDDISLKQLVVQRGDEGLSLTEYVSILGPLLDALDTIHKGKTGRARTTEARMAIYHRDIKPDNILIVEEEDGKATPVLIDFGSARDIKAYRDTDEYKKTIKYKSGAFTPPEFTENDRRSIGPWSDLFGLGATIYSCITRDPLHDRSEMDDLRGDSAMVEKYGEEFLGLIMDTTELSAKDRPQSTGEWRERLAEVRCEPDVAIQPTKTVTSPISGNKKERVWPIWCGVALALIAGAWIALQGKLLFVDQGEGGKEKEIAGIKFQWCPPGTFTMGTPETEPERYGDEILREVTLTQGYWLAKYECTQAQWQKVMGNNPSFFKGDQKPVESISWAVAQMYLQRLNDTGMAPEGWEFRLPTEAEWEYACRAGTRTTFSMGNSLNGQQANCNGQVPYETAEKGPFLGETADVGSYPANMWGLHDMHGNVEEFCSDWHASLPAGPKQDPLGPANGSARVGRGGFWEQPGEGCRAGKRGAYPLSLRTNAAGFRVALAPVREDIKVNDPGVSDPALPVDEDHPFARRVFQIKNSAGMLLDADQFSLGKEGSLVHLWHPSAGRAIELNQHWKIVATSQPHFYEIMNLDSECGIFNLLDGQNTKETGGAVSLKKDNENTAENGVSHVQNQWWKIRKTESGRYIFENAMQGLVLAYDEETMANNGGKVLLKIVGESEGVNEWTLEEVAN